MKKEFTIIILLIISLSCTNRIKKSKSKLLFSEKEKDTITSIISKLYGDWISTDKEILNLNQKGIYNCHMTFNECLTLRDIREQKNNQFENQVCIEEIIMTSQRPINSPEPDLIDIESLIKKIYLPDSFEIRVTKKGNYFGLLYQEESRKNEFIPIKFLNNNLLILMDGREYKKITYD